MIRYDETGSWSTGTRRYQSNHLKNVNGAEGRRTRYGKYHILFALSISIFRFTCVLIDCCVRPTGILLQAVPYSILHYHHRMVTQEDFAERFLGLFSRGDGA